MVLCYIEVLKDDTVLIRNCPPLSSRKRFTLERIVASPEREARRIHEAALLAQKKANAERTSVSVEAKQKTSWKDLGRKVKRSAEEKVEVEVETDKSTDAVHALRTLAGSGGAVETAEEVVQSSETTKATAESSESAPSTDSTQASSVANSQVSQTTKSEVTYTDEVGNTKEKSTDESASEKPSDSSSR
jgi:ribosomal protein S17